MDVEPMALARPSVEGTEASTPRSILLLGAHAVLLTRYVMATFLSAFFTPVATRWAISGSLNGLIFAAYPAGMALTSVVAPQIIQRTGIRWAITGGLLLTAGLTLGFGLTPDLVDVAGGRVEHYQYMFMAVYFMSGLLGSIAENASIILATERFSDKLGTVMASIGTVSGIGCMIGPVVGGVLYDLPDEPAQAFRLPFIVCFVFCVLLVPPLHAIMPLDGISTTEGQQPEGRPIDTDLGNTATGRAEGGREKRLSNADSRRSSMPRSTSNSLLLAPSVVLGLCATLLSGLIVATLDPTLSYRLSAPPFAASASMVSLVFMYSSVVYTLCSVPIGWLIDRCPPSSCLYKATTASGFLILAASFALLAPLAPRIGAGAPANLAWLPSVDLNSMGMVAIAMGLKGVGSALSNNAVYVDIVLLLPKTDKMLLATVSGLWNAAYSLGWALGPLVGGALYELTLSVQLCLGEDLQSDRCVQEALQGGVSAIIANTSLSTSGGRTAGLGVRMASSELGVGTAIHANASGPGVGMMMYASNSTLDALKRHAHWTHVAVHSNQPETCSCPWTADNGFDGMGMWLALTSLAYGCVLYIACVLAIGSLPPEPKSRSASIML